MTSTSARPLVGYAITYAIGDIVYGTPRLSGNTRPYAADKELGVVTAVEDADLVLGLRIAIVDVQQDVRWWRRGRRRRWGLRA